ncbi:hypothetical protein ACWD7M_16225 [Streptomyces griseus]
MTVTDPAQKIRLQGVGWVPAAPAHELVVGDQLMYNGGSVYQITKIVDASPKFFTIHEVSTQNGEEYQRRVKKDRPAARVAEKHRRPLGYHAAPATDYRAQISPPTGNLGWITVGHGDTFDAAVSGLTPSRQESTHFASVMDDHGLGWTAENHEGRAESLKAMREGATLTATDGHSFRVLPPENQQFARGEVASLSSGRCSCPRGESNVYQAHHRAHCAPVAEPYAVGTRVRHTGQEWARATAAPKGTAVVVAVGPEHHGGTREYEVLAAEEFSRRPGPDNPLTKRTEWNSGRVRFVAPPRFTVLPLGSTHGVWDTDTELWSRTGTEEACQQAADGLNVHRLTLDPYGRVLDPQRPTEGPYAVYLRPDDGYAPDAHRATLEEAKQCAEDGATARGLNPKGLGYHWDVTETTRESITWGLRSVYDWARPTGISVEGPRPI